MLGAYGASEGRWPEAERRALRALVESSAEARQRVDLAARLDAVLDAATIDPPSQALAERILGAAPSSGAAVRVESVSVAASELGAASRAPARHPTGARVAGDGRRREARRERTARVWRSAAAIGSLAAAAALALWVTRDQAIQEKTAADNLEVAAITSTEVAQLGVFTMPTDTLLDPPGVDLSNGVPALGCSSGDLGCPDFSSGDLADPTSRSQVERSRRSFV